MRRLTRWLRWALAGAAVAVLLAAAAVAGLVWVSLPEDRLHASVPGLGKTVQIDFDRDGIPWVHAESALDAATALGFVHARDRMFQMDLMRRAAAGRLSEIVGPASLPYDRMMRVLGLRRRAIEDYAGLPADGRAMLDAYSRGVNAWIDLRGRFAALEFLPFGVPEHWTSVDCLLWAKTMGLFLSNNYRTELARLALAAKLPQARIDQLWPLDGEAGRPDAAVADPGSVKAAGLLQDVLPRFPAPFTLPSTASNAWAVSGAHTATGAPLLAGDPHLGFSQPGIWYLVHVETPQGVLVGASAPGIPFLVLGHNGHIAWSFTSTGADVQDVFRETPVDATHYQGPDGPLAYKLQEERIAVRGQPDALLTVRSTRHGPVISDLDAPDGAVLAVAMGDLMPGDMAAAGLLELNRATTVEEAGRAAADITSPVQNMMVADARGIGLYVTGRVPVRRGGDGAAPVDGAQSAHDWNGFAGGAALPHVVDPPSGRLVNANDRVAPPDFPVFLGRDWFGAWRSSQIRALLGGSDHLTVGDFAAMQTDVHSMFAAQVLARLRTVRPPDKVAARSVALLSGWDGSMTRDSPQPLIFNAWMQRFRLLLLAKAGLRMSEAVAPLEFLAFVLSPDGASWCGGDCSSLLVEAVTTSTALLASQYGEDPAAWRWGVAHEAVFAHPLLSRIPLLGALTTARIGAPGDDSTVDRGSFADGGFDAVHGASFRGAYDLADLDRSRFIVSPGQSGNPASRHARDFVERWRDGETVLLGPQPSAVAASIVLERAP